MQTPFKKVQSYTYKKWTHRHRGTEVIAKQEPIAHWNTGQRNHIQHHIKGKQLTTTYTQHK